MSMLNVSAMDTRDSKGRGRFFPFIPQQHLFHVPKENWYWQANYYPEKEVYSFLFKYYFSGGISVYYYIGIRMLFGQCYLFPLSEY